MMGGGYTKFEGGGILASFSGTTAETASQYGNEMAKWVSE